MLSLPRHSGVSIIEVMMAIAIVALLVTLGVPAMKQWMDDSRVRLNATAIHSGIQLARAEAIRLNELVRFQLTSSMSSSCGLSSSASNWVVSIDDPTGACDSAPAPLTALLTAPAPRIIQTRQEGEGGETYKIRATGAGAAQNTLTYNGAGRLSGGNNIDTIEIPNPAELGTARCQHEGGDLRCLRIRILSGGDAVICDPKVTNAGDVRLCP
jgi:type IV fimbrial biogenesis protein FimT